MFTGQYFDVVVVVPSIFSDLYSYRGSYRPDRIIQKFDRLEKLFRQFDEYISYYLLMTA